MVGLFVVGVVALAHARPTLYADVRRAWNGRDDAALERLLGDDLLVEWRRRLADFERKGWVNEVTIRRGPEVEYVGLVNRAGDAADRFTMAPWSDDERLRDELDDAASVPWRLVAGTPIRV